MARSKTRTRHRVQRCHPWSRHDHLSRQDHQTPLCTHEPHGKPRTAPQHGDAHNRRGTRLGACGAHACTHQRPAATPSPLPSPLPCRATRPATCRAAPAPAPAAAPTRTSGRTHPADADLLPCQPTTLQGSCLGRSQPHCPAARRRRGHGEGGGRRQAPLHHAGSAVATLVAWGSRTPRGGGGRLAAAGRPCPAAADLLRGWARRWASGVGRGRGTRSLAGAESRGRCVGMARSAPRRDQKPALTPDSPTQRDRFLAPLRRDARLPHKASTRVARQPVAQPRCTR
jgi:hypothetical protein